jgi:hypothetical protein
MKNFNESDSILDEVTFQHLKLKENQQLLKYFSPSLLTESSWLFEPGLVTFENKMTVDNKLL